MIDSLQYLQLQAKVNALKFTVDSLQQQGKLQALTYQLNKQHEIISQVDSFYDSAWIKLILFLSIAGGVFLLIFGYVLPAWQRKDQKEMIQNALLKLEESIEEQTNKLDTSMEIVNSKTYELEMSISEQRTHTDASIHFLQARDNFVTGDLNLAFDEYTISAILWHKSNYKEGVLAALHGVYTIASQVTGENKLVLKGIKNFKLEGEGGGYYDMEGVLALFSSDENLPAYGDSVEAIREELNRIKKIPIF